MKEWWKANAGFRAQILTASVQLLCSRPAVLVQVTRGTVASGMLCLRPPKPPCARLWVAVPVMNTALAMLLLDHTCCALLGSLVTRRKQTWPLYEG